MQIAGEYYRDKLGFEVTYFDKNPSHYAYANRGEIWMHFARFADVGPAPNSVAVPPDMFDVYVYVDDVDALHAELAGRGAEIIGGVTDTEYGCREFRVRDPDGYILAFDRAEQTAAELGAGPDGEGEKGAEAEQLEVGADPDGRARQAWRPRVRSAPRCSRW